MVNLIKHPIARLLNNEDGASLVEYVLLLALIAMGALLGLKFFGQSVTNKFGNNNDSVGDAMS